MKYKLPFLLEYVAGHEPLFLNNFSLFRSYLHDLVTVILFSKVALIDELELLD